jgi:hypothetical protein
MEHIAKKWVLSGFRGLEYVESGNEPQDAQSQKPLRHRADGMLTAARDDESVDTLDLIA